MFAALFLVVLLLPLPASVFFPPASLPPALIPLSASSTSPSPGPSLGRLNIASGSFSPLVILLAVADIRFVSSFVAVCAD